MARTTLHDHLAFALSHAERRVTARLAAQFSLEGAGVEYWRVLQALEDGHGRTMGELADAALFNQPALTKLIDRMVCDSLVYRRQGIEDRRQVAVYLSTQGRALLGRLDARAEDERQRVVAELGSEWIEGLMGRLSELVEALGDQRQ